MTAKTYDNDIIEVSGLSFRVTFEPDYDCGMPWENCDMHGPVRCSNVRHGRNGETDKRPGERPLNSPDRNEYQYYYDWAGACELAKRDGWDTEPLGAPNRVQRAVQADYDYLCQYLNNDWQYVTVGVQQVDPDTEEDIGECDYLGMVETYNDYHMTQAREMAEYLAAQALAESAECNYWASRDVVTCGVAA